MTILLVDDDDNDVELTKRAFSKAGIDAELSVIRDGGAAMEYLCKAGEISGDHLPDVDLMDVHMGDVGGLDIVRKFKQTPGGKKMPVLMLTSSRDEMDMQDAYGAGANSYLVKPVALDAFVEVANAIRLYWVTYSASPTKT